MHRVSAVLLVLIAFGKVSGQTYTISTFAGGGLPANIPGTSASLNKPTGVAVDPQGNIFFINQSIVFRLDAKTGLLTPAAGDGNTGTGGDNGLAIHAELGYAASIAVDAAGNLYLAGSGVRKVSNGVITTLPSAGLSPGGAGFILDAIAAGPAGEIYAGAGAASPPLPAPPPGLIFRFSNGAFTPVNVTWADTNTAYRRYNVLGGLAVDSAGNLYISYNDVLLEVSGGVTTTVAQLSGPGAVAVDPAGNLYVADPRNNRIVGVSNGVVSTVAGNATQGFGGDNGPAANAELNSPSGIAVDTAGNLYIADTGNSRIRRVSNGVITTVAGNGTGNTGDDNGRAGSAQLNGPAGVAADFAGNVYLADTGNNRVRKVSKGVITTVAGNGTPGFSGDNGPATSAQLNGPASLAVDSAGNLYIADIGNDRVRKVSGGVITTVAGSGSPGGPANGPATGVALDFSGGAGIAVDSAGNLYIAALALYEVTGGTMTTVVAGGGISADNIPVSSASVWTWAIAVDAAGNLFIVDGAAFQRVRKISNGILTTVAGSVTPGNSPDGPATSAFLQGVPGVAVDASGNVYFLNQDAVREVSSGVLTTIAGKGPSLGDGGPASNAALPFALKSIAVDSSGNVYIADAGENRIRMLTPGTKPSIAQGGIVPVYSSTLSIQPGSWISIYGTDLASGTAVWNGDFPTSLGGTSVTIDNKPAYLWFVSPTQINLQVPDDTATAPVSVAVTTASGTTTGTVTLAAQAPSFSLLGDGRHVAAEIATPNGTGAYGEGTYDLAGPSNTFSFSTRPVKAGETLILYGVGFGATNPVVPAGKVFAGRAPVSGTVTVTIGGVNAPVAFAGITQAGLYQINVAVPNAASGDQPVQATVNGVRSAAGPIVNVQ